MIIRPAKFVDIPILMRMGHDFYNVTNFAEIAPLCDETIREFFEALIEKEEHVFLVLEAPEGIAGFTIALVFQAWFNRNVTMAQELLWWIEPDHRKQGAGIELLAELERAVIEKGAQSFIVASLDNLEPDRLARLYARRGYVPHEHMFLRGLNAFERGSSSRRDSSQRDHRRGV